MGLRIIDTHEHLPVFEKLCEQNTDILREYLLHSFISDLRSAGMSDKSAEQARDISIPLLKRWDMVEPFWEQVRYTGYGQVLDLAARDIYGFPRIDRDTIEPLNSAFMAARKPGHFKHVLKDLSKIDISINDNIHSTGGSLDCDKTFFRSVFRLERFLFPENLNDIKSVEEEMGIRIQSLSDWIDACEEVFNTSIKNGAVALKLGLAYSRPLRFDRPRRAEASHDFNFLRDAWKKKKSVQIQDGRKLQDFMMHHVMSLANRRGLVCQFHTGHLEGAGAMLGYSDPLLLNNLFLEYPDVKFDIFHIGWPFQNHLSSLAKMFRNVFVDMCTAHIISPIAAYTILCEWLESMPLNKICAFGGDYVFVDGVYGSQLITRRNVARAIASKVDTGLINIERAKEIAEMLFIKNPKLLFGI